MNTPVVKFTPSDSDYGLWKALSAFKGQTDLGSGTAEVLTQLFVLNQDSEKARTTAALILAEKAAIDVKSTFTARAGKSNGKVVEFQVTGAQILAKAEAIVLIGRTDVTLNEIAKGKQKEGQTEKPSKGDKLAGLKSTFAASPAPVPAKK